MAEPIRIVVLEGDETGQELLEAALAVIDPGRHRSPGRARALRPLAREPPSDRQRRLHRGGRGDARRRAGPEGGDDHARGSRRRRQPEPADPRGHRRHRDRPHRPADPRRHPDRRHPPPDHGLPDGRRRRLRSRAVARGRRRRRDRVPDRADQPPRLPRRLRARLPDRRRHRPTSRAPASTAARSGPSARSTRAC